MRELLTPVSLAASIKIVCEDVEQEEVLYTVSENVKFQLNCKAFPRKARNTCISQTSCHMSGNTNKGNEVGLPKYNFHETIHRS